MNRISLALALVAGALVGSSCTVHQTETPDLMGPSEFALSLSGPEKKPTTAPSSLLGGSKIDQPAVTHVYLRKQGEMNGDADNAWRLQSARVWLMNDSDPTLIWESRGSLTLSIEDGLQVWLGKP